MALQKLLAYRWFKEQAEQRAELESFESNFKSSELTQEALLIYIDHELEKLDKSLSLAKLKELPDRGEYALTVLAQKEALTNLKQLLLED